jgi:tetratricopeptide (TPR) repeat protein
MIATITLAFLLTASPLPTAAQTGRKASHTASAPAASFEQLAQTAARARDDGRDDDAIRAYREALRLNPDWEEGLWYLGTTLYQKERYAEARDELRRFLTLAPTAGAGWAVLGMSEYQTREYVRALDHLKRSMQLGVGERKELSQSVRYFVSVLLTRLGSFEDATGMIYEMRASGQPEALLLEPAGLAALRMPLLPDEIPADRREMVRVAGAAAFALADQRQTEAQKLLGELAMSHSQETGVHYLYGVFLMKMSPEDGIPELQRELEVSPSHIPARLRIAEQYVKESRFDAAEPLLDQALKLDPQNASAHMLLGEALMARGKTSDGIRELEAARDQAPDTVRIRWDLIRAYSAAGRTADANREKTFIEKQELRTGIDKN